MRILKLGFFHRTTPPGPIRGILGPFSFLRIFHRVFQVIKRLPGDLRIPGVPDEGKVA